MPVSAGDNSATPVPAGVLHPWRAQSCGSLSFRSRRNAECRSRPSGVHSRNRTSHTCVGSTHVVVRVSGICAVGSGSLFSAPTGPKHGGSGRTIGRSSAASSRSCGSLNPVPTRPAYTRAPFTKSASWSAPKLLRVPSGLVNPTMTKSPVRSALILIHCDDRPPRYGASDFLATIPSSPNSVTCWRNASPSRSMWSRKRTAPRTGTATRRSSLRRASARRRRSKSSKASRSKAKSVAGSSTAARLTSIGAVKAPRCCRSAKLGFPCGSSTTTSPSIRHSSRGRALIARTISGNAPV